MYSNISFTNKQLAVADLSTFLYSSYMHLYFRIASFNFATYFAYPFELLAAALSPLIDFGFVLLFWAIVAENGAGSVNFKQITAYFLIATAVSNIVFINNIRLGSLLTKAIKRGQFSAYLIRPVNVLGNYIGVMVGTYGVTYVMSVLFFITGIGLQSPTNWLGVVLFLAYLPLAVAISYSINVLVGTVAFYFTEAGSIKNVVNHIVRVLSGAWAPLTLFPSTLRNILNLLPFQTAVYGPTHALQTTTMSNTIWLNLGTSTIWAVALWIIATAVWQRGMKRYEAIGL